MRPTVHFLSGLPRSGSTLLANILAQNPKFRCAGTSGLVQILLKVRNEWDCIPEFRAAGQKFSDYARVEVLHGMLWSYVNCFDEEEEGRITYFDKSRLWPGYIELLEECLNGPCKIICCLRDIREVLASLEMLWRKNAATRQIPYERDNPAEWRSIDDRMKKLMSETGMVGAAYRTVLDAVQRGYGDRLLPVHYEALTREPAHTLRRIHDWLGEAPFEYNFENVKQVTQEDDSAYGFMGLHDIKPKVEPQAPKWPTVLGDAAKQYEWINQRLGM